MDNLRWQHQLSDAILDKLDAERELIATWTVRRLDIGIFPWHGLIELSFQSADEMHLCASIGDWRHYNFTAADGKWTAAAHLKAEMQTEWTRDHSAAERFFVAAGNVAKSASLQGRLSQLFPDAVIHVTVFNPDNVASRNYAA